MIFYNANPMSDSTPMMAQYRRAKRECPGCILFFRLGDFYEMFAEDALEVSGLLNLTLTKRGEAPMCGVPYHASRSYIARLLRLGKKVAVCEQVSEPGVGRGLVERKIVEIVTPGTALEEDYLDAGSFNYVAAFGASSKGSFSFAFLDVSTGDFRATSFGPQGLRDRLRKELGRIQPRELIVQESLLEEISDLAELFRDSGNTVINRFPDWYFDQTNSVDRLRNQFGTSNLKGFGFEDGSIELLAAGVLLTYADDALRSSLPHVRSLTGYGDDDFVGIDDATRRNLELIRNLQDGSSRFTLYESSDETRTAMRRRLLKRSILLPLRSPDAIRRRLDVVEAFYRDQGVLSAMRDGLARVHDIERLASRVATDRAHAKDLVSLRESLAAFSRVEALARDLLGGKDGTDPEDAFLSMEDLSTLESLRLELDGALLDEPSILLSEGGIFRAGYHENLDELRRMKADGRAVLEAYVQEERDATGIQNLKIKYNRLIGYFMEVTKANLGAVPERFIRRQGIAGGERYTTDRLVDLETRLNTASDQIIDLERSLFMALREKTKTRLSTILDAARRTAFIDVSQSMARAATVRGWNRPHVDSSLQVRIIEGRHPVVEAALPRGDFVPNDLFLDADGVSFDLITGPNMAGKSTYLRQSAIIILLAQIGSFVPAREAHVGVVDKVFCRVGASDNLARGESTFLVEMNETANILRNASHASLVIMDEVGRGTGTSDGLSIAWAVCEELLDGLGCRSLFATHYHELARIEHPRLANRCLDVLEREGEIVFRKKVKDGASAESYGIHVAKIAGLPDRVVERAKMILNHLKGSVSEGGSLAVPPKSSAVPNNASAQGGLFSEEELIADELRGLDINKMTPLDALGTLARWKDAVKTRY